MNIRISLPLCLSLVGLTIPSVSMSDSFVVMDSDFVDGVYEFRYYSSRNEASVNGTEIMFSDLFLTNDGWVAPSSTDFFWRAMGSFLNAQDSGSGTLGWDLRAVTQKIDKVELLADGHLSQFDQWRTHAWCDRLYGRIALPDTDFGTDPYLSVFEFVGDNDPNLRVVETAGFVDDITDIIRRIDADWLDDPTLFELKVGYQEHPEDTAHPPIPYNHLQIFRDNTGMGDDSFLLRITLSESRLINISTRGQVGIGPQKMIAGFVIQGAESKTVLIRGVGPTLGNFGVTGVLEDSFVDLVRKTPTGDVPVSENDDWGGDAAMASAMTAVGAFPLDTGSKDACLLVTLEPGAYTAKVSGVGDLTGVALVEVYEVP